MNALARAHRLVVVTLLGFASGLPLALTGQALQAWMTVEGLDLATIGFLTLVGLPYTFKFLWAPLMDRFDLPLWGRRRGWLVVTQLALALALWGLSMTRPSQTLQLFALLAVTVAFLSASQDVVIDAYRTDVLGPTERGLGASLNVMGYRLAMIVSGGLALIWTDAQQGQGWDWPQVYRLMALLMLGAAALSATVLPRLPPVPSLGGVPASDWKTECGGFAAVVVAVAVGAVLTQQLLPAVVGPVLGPALEAAGWAATLRQRWIDLSVLLLGVAVTLPLAAWAARQARFETLLAGLRNYFSLPGAAAFLLFIVLYKLGDAFAGALMTAFLLKGMAYTSAEVGVVNKVIGLWLTIGGALLGGALMLRLGLWRALMIFGVLQLLSNLGFWWLAVHGKSASVLLIPAFDWAIVRLSSATPVDAALLWVVAFENISGGMGTAAFVAFLMSLCTQRFTATQFALLSAFAAVGRVWVGPLAGVLAESVGWGDFFLLSLILGAPALIMGLWLRRPIEALEPKTPPAPGSA